MITSNIRVTAGSQTFSRSSGNLSAFIMNRDESNKRKLHSKVLKAAGKGTYLMAHVRNLRTSKGYFSQDFEAEEGQVLCLQAQNSKGGAPIAQAMLFISIRSDGPLLTVDYVPVPDRESSLDFVEAFSGRGDILSTTDLKSYGIVLNKMQIRNFMDAEEVDELFTVTVLDKGSPKPEKRIVVNEEGEEKTIFVRRARRKIHIRK